MDELGGARGRDVYLDASISDERRFTSGIEELALLDQPVELTEHG